ncbi:phospholipase A-2-activating protein [Punctularia strigosozonata HHB-11173 SS5]|uniref:phospholipase A-2-activating protein n=1 Tax=Punctularia strigosozonata (strain HHB-11173) TaxID=741275 RepID=UPI00044177DE|nr:phospholipase A-2-activating protein [Punctularia strigosozonata HHB-11173 SS5]EIN07144.1 phospholipase A-2-activating protein [Punctularia strigosozonata HHB-11173 SS5]
MSYKLSATLSAHSQDVRAVASPTNDLILSASRDSTAIAWARDETSTGFQPHSVLRAGSRFVNAIAYVPPTTDAPKGFAVTGGQDTVINVFDLANPKEDPDFTLIGHGDNVCALHVSPDGTIISGSWDKTAKVWKDWKLAYDLKGHQASVWAVLALDHEQCLTGSADKSIKLWQKHRVIRNFQGHNDAVRGLAVVPDIGFASCSNDSQIHVWTLEGDIVYSLSGHTSFVYSLALLPNGDIVSGGEDRSVRVWRDGECAQTIVHPAISVWTVSVMPNGDIVSGCSDGVVRVFSADTARHTSAEDLKAFEDQVASQALPAQQVANMSNVQGPEALAQPGKKPGQVIMVKNDRGGVEAHQWDASSGWQKIGDVVDAVGSGRKQLYQGREYDYVFDVDIKDGAPPLKLPYNANENPFAVAQRFLEANDLPMSYIDQVVEFINRNTQGATIGAGGSEYIDPYTGASRYQSSSASVPAAGPSNSFVDPFTGANRYAPVSSAPAPAQNPAALSDPYTGSSRYSSAPAPAPAPAPSAPAPAVGTPAVLPVTTAFSFKTANVPPMRAKIYEFEQAFRTEISTLKMTMSPGEIRQFDEVFSYLAAASSPITEVPPSPVSPKHLEVVLGVLERWPLGSRFPHTCRLILGYCPETLAQPGVRLSFIQALFKSTDWFEPWTSAWLDRSKETNFLLLFRGVSNVFQADTPSGEAWVAWVIETLAHGKYELLSKPQRVAFATLLFNVSTTLLNPGAADETRDTLFRTVLQGPLREQEDSEGAYRGLVALGNIIYAAKKFGFVLDGDRNAAVQQALEAIVGAFPELRVKTLAGEIKTLL